MAKSTRSKVKRSYRAKKREDGVYAAEEAARLQRLHDKLAAVRTADKDGDVEVRDDDQEADEERLLSPEATGENPTQTDTMELDGAAKATKKISTHGPRLSRHAEWRTSKGMSARPDKKGRINRQGVVVAKHRAGRAKRRR